MDTRDLSVVCTKIPLVGQRGLKVDIKYTSWVLERGFPIHKQKDASPAPLTTYTGGRTDPVTPKGTILHSLGTPGAVTGLCRRQGSALHQYRFILFLCCWCSQFYPKPCDIWCLLKLQLLESYNFIGISAFLELKSFLSPWIQYCYSTEFNTE